MTLHTGRFNALAFAALILMLVSCEGHEPSHALDGNGKGKVMLSLGADLVIDVKSEAAPVADYADYNFRYVGVDGYATSEYYRYGNVSWPMDWYFGVFRLQAESCTAEEAETGRGCLRYEGISQPFAVINDQLATASVTCTVANVRVNVNYNDKMFMSFADFYLSIESVISPVYEEDEDGNMVEIKPEQSMRALDFTTIEKTGYFNIHSGNMNLKYRLYVRMEGAEQYLLKKEGYLSADDGNPELIKSGDDITFNVVYEGDVDDTENVTFIVEGERLTMHTGLDIKDYEQGAVVEDK